MYHEMTYDSATSSDKCLASESKTRPPAGPANVNINNNNDNTNNNDRFDEYQDEAGGSGSQCHQDDHVQHIENLTHQIPDQNNHQQSDSIPSRISCSTSSDNTSTSGGSIDTSCEPVNQINKSHKRDSLSTSDSVCKYQDEGLGLDVQNGSALEQNNCEQKEKERIKSPALDDGSSPVSSCYNQVLDDEIRARLDKLNALSDLINSLERQSDEANGLFRDTLKCSTERLSSIAKALGTKSIRHGRVYYAAKISVEQSQSDCQRACVQFERANNDHHLARQAIQEAEMKLRSISRGSNSSNIRRDVIGSSSPLNDHHHGEATSHRLADEFCSKLSLQTSAAASKTTTTHNSSDNISTTECDKDSSAFVRNNNNYNNDIDEQTSPATDSLVKSSNTNTSPARSQQEDVSSEKNTKDEQQQQIDKHHHNQHQTSPNHITTTTTPTPTASNTTINTQPEGENNICKENIIDSKTAQETTNHTDHDGDGDGDGLKGCHRNVANIAAMLGEELNMATRRLREAEELRRQSERQHLNEASKLMVAQENLLKLERQYGPSIKRSQLYFEEAKRFNARLNSVKSDINRISDEILAAKQAYALTLSELEQFSDDLHEASSMISQSTTSYN